MSFRLVKWYADAVAPDGRYAIVYRASLHYSALRFRYSALIEGAPGQPAATRLRAPTGWHVVPTAPPYEQTLLETPAGRVHWNCRAPSASVAWNGFAGHGYLERIELTIPPWRLPIQTLHWGRFITPHQSLVWIEWLGPHPLRLTLHNGLPIDTPYSELLTLHPVATIRQGPIGPNVLQSIPGLSAPARLLKMHECKLLSRARLHSTGETGWAIHETVVWP